MATSEVWLPSADKIISDNSLEGSAFFMWPRVNDTCYFAANVMTRLDEKRSTLFDTYNSKKVFVVEAGNPPQLIE